MSAIVCSSRYILTAGWSRVVRVYSDLIDDVDNDDAGRSDCAGCSEQWMKAHDEDIMCMALLRPTTVVTASYDGDLVVWSLDNGNTVARFNAELSTRPLSKPTQSPRRRRTYVTYKGPPRPSPRKQPVSPLSRSLGVVTSFIVCLCLQSATVILRQQTHVVTTRSTKPVTVHSTARVKLRKENAFRGP